MKESTTHRSQQKYHTSEDEYLGLKCPGPSPGSRGDPVKGPVDPEVQMIKSSMIGLRRLTGSPVEREREVTLTKIESKKDPSRNKRKNRRSKGVLRKVEVMAKRLRKTCLRRGERVEVVAERARFYRKSAKTMDYCRARAHRLPDEASSDDTVGRMCQKCRSLGGIW